MLPAYWTQATQPVLEAGDSPGAGTWVAVILISVSTLAGALLARRESTRLAVRLAIASAIMVIIALTDLLPGAWQDAVETGVPLWVVGIAVAFGFLVVTYFTRKGCACPSDAGRTPAGPVHSRS